MSVSIPDPQPANVPAHEPEPRVTAKVVQLPLDSAARHRQEALRVTAELRRQLALLSRHYAEDASRFQQQLTLARARARKAQAETLGERRRAACVEAELFGLRGDVTFVRERLAAERRRASRLAEVARLPWWAFGRRRWALASIEADETS